MTNLEYTEVVTAVDVPRYGLRKGTIGTVVDVNPDGTAYEVEFDLLAEGEVTATLSPDEISAVEPALLA